MAHNNNNRYDGRDVDGRGLSIYVIEGLRYYLNDDPILGEYTIPAFLQSLVRRWNTLTLQEKEPWLERAREEIRELRYRHEEQHRRRRRSFILHAS